jgi:hypothetical protein
MEYRPVKIDFHSLVEYQRLFKVCFPRARHLDLSYLKWLYKQNPEGPAIGFDAFDQGFLAAHYCCVPAPVNLYGKTVKGLLSLNTATHPRYRGQGLFTTLAEMTYDAATQNSFSAVFGVANFNSSPVFIRKLGFQLVGSLDARIGFGTPLVDIPLEMNETSFSRIWNKENLEWRLNNPANPIKILSSRRGIVEVEARTHVIGINIYGLAYTNWDTLSPIPNSSLPHLSLFLGVFPKTYRLSKMFLRVPSSLKPSPLNLIFRDLTHAQNKIETSDVFFNFLDFDAY